MAKRRHTAEQIISKLREAEVSLDKGHPLAEALHNAGKPKRQAPQGLQRTHLRHWTEENNFQVMTRHCGAQAR